MREKTTQKLSDHQIGHQKQGHRLDPRAPFVLDTRELGRRPGSIRPLQRRVPAPAGLATDMIGVAEGAALTLDLQLQSVTEGVLITGSVTAPLHGECGRCLNAIDDQFASEIVELFAYSDSTTDDTSDEDEVHRIVDDLIDVEPVVRDVVVLGLPTTPLCRPDCAGLCPQCGQRLDDVAPGHAHESVDSRWAGLKAFGSLTAEETGRGDNEVTDQE